MAEGGRVEASQDVSSDMTGECVVIRSCEPCMRKKSASTAAVICKDCNEHLCDHCSYLHEIYKPGKHEMVVIENVDSAPVVVNMKGMDKCQEHGKKIKFFCEDHSKLCCNACAFIHRKCDNVNELAIISRQEGQKLQDLTKSLLKMESKTGSIIADCKLSEEALNETIANLPKQVDELKDRIVNMFGKAKKKMMTEANNFKEEEVKRLGERNEASSKVKKEINDLLPVCSALVDHGTPQQKYIITKRIEEKMKEIETHITEQGNKHVTLKVSLTFPAGLSSLLTEEEDIFKLNAERHLTHTDAVQTSPTKGQGSSEGSKDANVSYKGSSSASSQSVQIKPVTIELLVSVDIKQTGDDEKEPFLSGLDFLSDGRLVAVENRNMKCIILNDMLQRQGTPYKFKTYPYDVVCFSQNEIAVTLNNYTVCLLSVSPDNVTSLTREIKTSSSVFSICCMTPSNMVVSTFYYPRSARMITADGVESDFDHVVFSKTYKQEESKCTYVQSKNTLVLTDTLAHTVYMYDTIKGTSIAVTDKNIQKPRGACVGPVDTVFVCSQKKNSIVHLTVDGAILGTYPVDMEYPYSLCMNKDGTRLAVSNRAIGRKKLLMYKIS